MALRGKKPEQRKPRLKALMFGEEGVGKTLAAIQMPRPYIIDTESGCDHYGDIIEDKGGAVFPTTSLEDTIAEVRALTTEKHDFLTLVIDPFTTLYDTELEIGEKKVGADFGRHYGYAGKASKRLYHLLTQLDMNVVMTAHAKNEYGDNMKIVGRKPDGWKKLGYLFDLVFFLEREKKSGKRFATVAKTRLKEFPDQSRFEWGFDALAERYGRDLLERQAEAVALATLEQVERFKAAYAQLSEAEVKRLKIDKVLRTVEDPSDLTAERIENGIKLINDHLKASAA